MGADRHLHPVLNWTKWEELRLAMDGLGPLHPRWRTRDLAGSLSPWNGEWYDHFRQGGYLTIEWVEIEVATLEQEAAVLGLLRQIHVPGERTEPGFRVFGHWTGAGRLDYL